MGLFKKNYVKIYFKKTAEMMDYLKRRGLVKNIEIERELYAFNYVIASIILLRLDKEKEAKKISNELYDKFPWIVTGFTQRMDFYSQFLNGKEPRAEYIPEESRDFSNAYVRLQFAFEDILMSPNLIDDYDNAPLLILPGMELINFTITMDHFHNLIVDLIKSLGYKE